MSDWHDLTQQIRELQTKVDRAELLDPKTVQNTLYSMLNFMHSMAFRMELLRVPPYQDSLTDLRIETLTNRVEVNEANANYRLGVAARQIKKDRDAILEKLDAILQRLPRQDIPSGDAGRNLGPVSPERPRGFDG